MDQKTKSSLKKKIFIKTFGCQMNEYDSNRIFDIVKKIGYKKTEDHENADCYLVNTCHIRDKAKEKVYHEVGRIKQIYLKKKKPIMVIAGCVAQAENKEMLKREPFIDVVIGPQSYHKINQILKNFQNSKKEDETEFDTIAKFDLLEQTKNSDSKVSSFLTIQEGCDKFCHFCVVPYTRGPEYSRPFNQIIEEANYLSDQGAKEIILLGQNVNAYDDNGKRLSNLILEIEKIKEITRIRYTTSHPKDMTKDLIETYKDCKKLMPLVHLPVQSGSDKILNLMNRKHKIDHYLKVHDELKKINQSIEFSSDFIIGYPGESEEDFQSTVGLIKKVNFINSYSFIFSPRPGTKAEGLDLIDKKISMERLEFIQNLLFENQTQMNKNFENRTINVLVENLTEDKSKAFGRSEYMTSVIFNGKREHIGKIVKVKITNSNRSTLFGELLSNPDQKVA